MNREDWRKAVKVCFSEAELAAIKRAAAEAKMPYSTWIREIVVIAACGVMTPEAEASHLRLVKNSDADPPTRT